MLKLKALDAVKVDFGQTNTSESAQTQWSRENKWALIWEIEYVKMKKERDH